VARVVFASALLAAASTAQGTFLAERVPCAIGGVVGPSSTTTDGFAPVGTLVRPGAPWLRAWLLPGDFPAGARLRLTAGVGDTSFEMDRAALEGFGWSTPYVDGDALLIEAFVPFGTTATVFVHAFDAGLLGGGPSAPQDSPCGPDNRISTTDGRVGRVLSPTFSTVCSGFLVGTNDVFATAGHCVAQGSGLVVQFDPPPSLPDGSLQHPPPSKQFAVAWSTAAFENFGPGQDWGAFRLLPNLTTGASASAQQGSFTLAATPPSIGASATLSGFGADLGTENHALQTDSGPVVLLGGQSGTELRYTIDTTSGSSGSPVFLATTGAVVAVHTHDGCLTTASNVGTSTIRPSFAAHVAAIDVPAAPVFSIDLHQYGPGSPLTLVVANAPPFAELFNVISFVPRTPLGSGPFFGLDAGSGEVFAFFAMPVGAAPFHVFADASGGYVFSSPTSGTAGPYVGDLVSIAFDPGLGLFGYLAASIATNATFTL
jgi:hypothetical protein